MPPSYADIKSCHDHSSELLDKIKWERCLAPYRIPDFESYPASQHQATIVYISNFTVDGIAFAYYIQDAAHRRSFLAGTFGMQAYDGPMFATPVVLHTRADLLGGDKVKPMYETHEKSRVSKHESKTETLRWRYLYETARLAWSKMVFDTNRWEMLNKGSTNTGEEALDKNAIYSDNEAEAIGIAEPSADLEIRTATSSEVRELEAIPNPTRLGKRSCSGTEESSIDLKTARMGIDANQDQSKGQDLDLRQDLETILHEGGNIDNIIAYISKRNNEGRGVLKEKQKRLVRSLIEVIELLEDVKGEHAKLRITGMDRTKLVVVESELRMEREDYIKQLEDGFAQALETEEDATADVDEGSDPNALSDEQQEALMQLIGVTGQDPGLSVLLLRANNWNTERAINHWFDAGGTTLSDTRERPLSNIQASSRNRPRHYATPGPSSSKRRALDTESSDDVKADRARLESLITSQDNKQDSEDRIREAQRGELLSRTSSTTSTAISCEERKDSGASTVEEGKVQDGKRKLR